MDIYKLNLSLETSAAIAVAISFWDSPVVKSKVSQILYECNRNIDDIPKKWGKVKEYAINQVDLCLPEHLLCKVKDLVQILGHKLYCWIIHVIHALKRDVVHNQKIYWTPNGEIDRLKIVKEYLLENEAELGGTKHECFLNKPSFCIASAYVEKEFIHNHLEEMKDEIFKHLLDADLDPYSWDWSGNDVISAWLIFCLSKTKTLAIARLLDLFESDDFDDLEDLVFSLCSMSVESGFIYAVQYFFNDNIFNDRYIKDQQIISQIASKCLVLCKNGFPHEKDIFLDILTFLINKMNAIEQSKFISENFATFFTELLYKWPYEEVCLHLLMCNSRYFPDVHDKILDIMMNDLWHSSYKLSFIRESIYIQVFKIILQIVPKEVKKDIFAKDNHKRIKSLAVDNTDIWILIINDPSLEDDRDQMIPIVENRIKELIMKGGRYRDVDKLMRLCAFEDKQKYDILTTFATTGRIKLAEEHLNWLCDSDTEKSRVMKKQMDSVTLCTVIIKGGRLDFASEYLNWQCSDEEEKKSIKEMMISNSVLRDQLYQVWCMHRSGTERVISFIKLRCEKLLRWFLESEEAMIEFKKNKLVENELFVEKYWYNLFHHNLFACLDDFLQYSFWSPEKIEELRQKIAKNAGWWIDTYLAEKNNFSMIKSLFNWVFKDKDEERIKVISNYMESPNGALLLVKIFKTVNSKSVVKDVFNTWLYGLPPFSISRIQMNLDAFNDGIICSYVISSIKSLLNEIKYGRRVYDTIINNIVYEKMSKCNCLMYRS